MKLSLKITSVLITLSAITMLSTSVFSCKKHNRSGPSGTSYLGCGESVPYLLPDIRGPQPGSGGNDQDNTFRALAIDPTNPQVIYVGSEGSGVFRSTDGGISWQWLRTGLYHCDDRYAETYNITIDPSDPAHLLMATNAGPGPATGGLDGVYISADSGNHWRQINTGLTTGDVNSVAFSPANASTLFCGLSGGGSTNSNDLGHLFYGGIFMSTDGGASWQALNNAPPLNTNNFFQMETRGPAGNFTLYTMGAQSTTLSTSKPAGLYKATANGTNWIPLFNAALNDTINGNMFDVSDDQRYLYVNNASFGPPQMTFKSTDSGVTWVRTAQSGNGPIRIVGSNPDNVVYASFSDIYKSTDGMATATRSFNGTVLNLNNAVMEMKVAQSNANIIYAVAKGLHIYKSIDGGSSFAEVANLRDYINAH